MHHHPLVRGQFRRQLVNRQIRSGRNPANHPIPHICQLAAPGIALRLWFKRTGLALEPNHVIDELDRNTQAIRCRRMRAATLNKRHSTFPQLNRMRLTHL